MKRLLLLTILSILTYTNKMYAQETPASYVEKAIQIMEQNSVNKKNIDWATIKKDALKGASETKNIRETYPIIRNILEKLEDHHSKLYEPEVVADYLKRHKDVGLAFPYPKDSLLGKKIAYISVPAIANFNQEDWNEYVQSFYDKVKNLDKSNPRIWIIDLRNNEGGMFSPMLKAIYPFLDAEKVVGSIDNSEGASFYSYKNSDIYFGKQKIAHIPIPDITIKNKNKPIYVLTNKRTASSGEFVVASL